MSDRKKQPILDLRKLRYVVEAARAGSISAAAKKLLITQPALTRNIIELEEELEMQIFQRLPRGIALTQAGEVLIERAHAILTDVAALASDLIEPDQEPQGRIKVGFSPAGYIHTVRDVVAAFADRHPQMKIDTVTGQDQFICPKLVRGDLDLVVGSAAVLEQWSEFEVFRITPLEFAWMVRKSHPLADIKVVNEKDVLQYPLIVPESLDIESSGLQVLYEKHGLGPAQPQYVTDDFSLVISLINNSDAYYALNALPHLMARLEKRFHMIRDTTDTPRHFVGVAVMKHRARSPAVRVLIEMIRESIVTSSGQPES